MTTTHPAVSLVAGDDWEIHATLLDENDVPFDLTSATILWTLVNQDYEHAIDPGMANIAIVDALAGTCTIQIPATVTSPLAAGFYTDILRIVTGGITSTLWFGSFYVMADAFAATVLNVRAVPPQLKPGLGGTVTIPFRPRTKPVA